jgi:hypothetical protein
MTSSKKQQKNVENGKIPEPSKNLNRRKHEVAKPVLRIKDVYPGSQIQIFHPGSRVQKISDPGSKIIWNPDPDPHKII